VAVPRARLGSRETAVVDFHFLLRPLELLRAHKALLLLTPLSLSRFATHAAAPDDSHRLLPLVLHNATIIAIASVLRECLCIVIVFSILRASSQNLEYGASHLPGVYLSFLPCVFLLHAIRIL